MNRPQLAVILYADGQTPGEIAWQFACPTETVRTYLRRARRGYVTQGRAQSRGLHRIALRALLVEDGLLAPEVSSHARTMDSREVEENPMSSTENRLRVFDQDFGPFNPMDALPREVVAVIRVPIGITELTQTANALVDAYGPDLVIRADLPVAGWIPFALPKQEAAAL